VKRKTYIGSAEGKILAAWLDKKHKKDALLKLVRLAAKYPLLEDTRTAIGTEIKTLARRWKIAILPQVVTIESGYTLKWREDWKRGVPTPQIQAFLAACKLIEWGLLARVRECANCRVWYFAVLPSQRFHSKDCQNEAANRDEQRRERRAESARNYRRARKERKMVPA
jgi:hypothetical protein